MQVKKFCRRVLNTIGMILAVLMIVLPRAAEANTYDIGIIGIESRVKDSEINLGDYTDLNKPELAKTPLEFAQGVFETKMNFGLRSMGAGFNVVDKSKQVTSARIDELIFQLKNGNPKEAVKLYDQKLDYLVYGYIANMTITHRESIASSNLSVRIDLTTRIVDASTGRVVCVATGKGESANRGGVHKKSFKLGGDEISDACWSEALNKALKQVVEGIKKQV